MEDSSKKQPLKRDPYKNIHQNQLRHMYSDIKTNLIESCKTKQERLELEKKSDEILFAIHRKVANKRKRLGDSGFDTVGSQKFDYYPDSVDTWMQSDLFKKREFREYQAKYRKGETTGKLDNLLYKPTPSQSFAKHYISPNTPYNGILLWHGVGVGKTCTSIRIAENFRDYVIAHKKKILILTPSETLIQTWRNEIFNIDKERKKYEQNIQANVQCTGDRYTREMNIAVADFQDESLRKRIRQKVKRVVHRYYDIMGYRTMVNNIIKGMKLQKIEDESVDEYKRIQYIRRRFSNMVIIMDEAHFIRDSGSGNSEVDKYMKLATPFIEMIVRYAENTKIILSTATPMYNSPHEIIGLLNLLLLNDKRAPLLVSDVFTKDGAFKDENAKKLFVNYSRGYISYVRGENPFDFPLKLEPNDSVYTPSPDMKYVAGELVPIDDSEKIKGIGFYRDEMSEFQYDVLKTIMENTEEESDSTGFGVRPLQASIIVFPNGEVGSDGFQGCIEHDKEKDIYRYVDEYDGFLDGEKIAEYSAKFKSILDSVQKSRGIVFVYSKFLESGITAMSLVLEENGFKRFKSQSQITHVLESESTANKQNDFCSTNLTYRGNLADDQRKSFTQASYIFLSSQTPNIDELLRICNSDDNRNGQKIKVILGSSVTGQGLNFKNIREVHILEPWYHFNALEQSVGRAIRRESHNALDDTKRNVTVYLHIAALPSDVDSDDAGIETYDERAYRIAYNKKVRMAEVERLLKVNAVDCELLRKGNQYTKNNYDIWKSIEDSHGNVREVPIFDKEGSMICDLQSCEYKCEIKDDAYNQDVDKSTYLPLHEDDKSIFYKEIIKQVFINDDSYTSDGIIKEIKKNAKKLGMNPDDDDVIIFKSLTDMIDRKDTVYNSEFTPGIVVAYKDSYVFTPLSVLEKSDNSTETLAASNRKFMNLKLPLLYRKYPNPILKPNIDVDEDRDIIEMKTAEEVKVEEVKVVARTIEELMDAFEEYYSISYDEVNEQYDEGYPDDDDERTNERIPTMTELVHYKFQSYYEHNLSDEERLTVLIHVVEKTARNEDLTAIEQLLFNYYDTPLTQTYIVRKKEKIVGILWYTRDGQVEFYRMNKSNQLRKISDPELIEPYRNSFWDTKMSMKTKVVGWLRLKANETTKKAFYLLNLLELSERAGQAENKKNIIKGAMCMTSGKMTGTSEQIIELINKLTGQKKDSKGQKDKKEPKKKTVICDELELILRHLDTISTNRQERYFYRPEEIYAQTTK
jgi:hypothetical protein